MWGGGGGGDDRIDIMISYTKAANVSGQLANK